MKLSAKRTILGIGVLTIVAVSYRIYSETYGSRFQAGLQQAEREMKKQLPKKVDDFTTLVDVKYESKKTTYFYVVDNKGDAIDWSKVQEGITAGACANEDILRSIKSKGFVYEYHYLDAQRLSLKEFEIVSCE